MQYLKRAVDLGVPYGDRPANMKLSARIDADHATYPDKRCSVSGAAVIFGGGGSIGSPVRNEGVAATATSQSDYYVARANFENELRFLRHVRAFMVPLME